MAPDWIEEWLQELVDRIGMKVLSGPYAEYVHVPGNRGVTGLVIIETSHIAMHVWDEEQPGLMQLDVYTCGPLDPDIVFDALDEFVPVKVEYKYLDREHGLIEVPFDRD
jgi:S-adenosylmethionine/arginine decarboxylase-like enzyme